MMAQDSRMARTGSRFSSLSRAITLPRRTMELSHVSREALTCLVLAVVVGLVSPTTAAQPRPLTAGLWSDPEVVGEIGSSPVIDIDEDGNAYVVWADGYDVYFRTRSAEGAWYPVEQVVTYSDWSRNGFKAAAGSASRVAPTWVNHLPGVAIDGLGRVHVVWVNNTPHPNRQTYVQYRLRDASGNWGPVEGIAQETTETGPKLAADGSGRTYVAWQDGASLEAKLRIRSSDGSWGGVESIGDGVLTDMTADAAGDLYTVLGSEDTVYFRRRSAAGDWGALETVNDEASSYTGAIDVDGVGNVYVATARPYPSRFYLNYRPAGGTWQGNVLVAQGLGPSFALDAAGNGYFVWLDDRDGDHIVDRDVYAVYRWRDGLLGASTRVSSSLYGVDSADVATRSSGDLYYLVWSEDEGGVHFAVGSKPASSPDLSVSRKMAVPGGVRPGEVVEYVFQVQNAGKTVAFVLTDTLPISTTLIPDSGWYDTGVLTASTRGITWTAVSTFGTTVRAGFSVTVTEDNGTGTARIPYVLPNVAGLSFGAGQRMELTAAVIVNPVQLYLPLVVRGG
jgi:uncharacterized repeat protein (TIGR01451 family)